MADIDQLPRGSSTAGVIVWDHAAVAAVRRAAVQEHGVSGKPVGCVQDLMPHARVDHCVYLLGGKGPDRVLIELVVAVGIDQDHQISMLSGNVLRAGEHSAGKWSGGNLV